MGKGSHYWGSLKIPLILSSSWDTDYPRKASKPTLQRSNLKYDETNELWTWLGPFFGCFESYCWWKKFCTTQHVWNPVNNGKFTIPTGAGFLPSTVLWIILYMYAWLVIGNIARSLDSLSTNQFEMECVSPLLAIFVEVTHEESTSSTHGLRYPNSSIIVYT